MKLINNTIAFLALCGVATAICPNHCSGHGECDSGGQVTCKCHKGWGAPDCSKRLCPVLPAWADQAVGVDEAHKVAECSARGICNYKTGICDCQRGFEGLGCQRLACPHNCNGRGHCRSMRRNAIMSLHFTAPDWTYGTYWDAEMIYGCVCDEGWDGPGCTERTCPYGDDPLTEGQANEIQYMRCQATGGYFVLSLDGKTSPRINWDDDDGEVKAKIEAVVGEVRLAFVDPPGATTVCSTAAVITEIEFLQRFGDVPPLQLPTDYQDFITHTTPSLRSIQIADEANGLVQFGGAPAFTARQGEREHAVCAGRGRCETSTGICHCFKGFDSSDGFTRPGNRGDCGYAMDAITACPGITECNGHGHCSGHPEYTCDCDVGWMGGDCGLRTCPSAKAWFDTPTGPEQAHNQQECSNRGICDRETGACACEPGFKGAACEKMTCPGFPDNECSGHGTCLSMSQLAQVATVNGEAADFTYGRTPHDAGRWDYDQVYGCFCEEGFHGYDCSQRDCPLGDDPKTPGVLEVQTVLCNAATGRNPLAEFTFSFRQQTSPGILVTASAADVKAQLEAMSTIDEVTVTFDGTSTTACPENVPHTWTVTFLSEKGDLPLMGVDQGPLSVGTLTISPNVDGTTENVPCSNRGICEEETGECQCFTQYGSSNGLGAPGTRPDCGAVMPYLPVPGQVIDYTHWRTRQSELLYNERQQMQGQKRNDDDDDFFGGK